ncbi:MAG: L-serine ammonia-lyase, iron-sulfur-dependent, subunit alpha [Desulfohalobiaceae bacterium]
MKYRFKDLLRLEVGPALGCTEPVAVALAAAAAASLLTPRQVDKIQARVSPGVFKNGIGVFIPGTGGLRGLDLAAALGALGGDPGLGMQVLAAVDTQARQEAGDLVSRAGVSLQLDSGQSGLLIEVLVHRGSDVARALILDQHDHLVELSLNHKPLPLDNVLPKADSFSKEELPRLEAWLAGLDLPELLQLSADLKQEDLDYLSQGVDDNLALARYGLEYAPGLAVGAKLQELGRQGILQQDLQLQAQILTAAAADARMSGAELPAMSSAGSGNNGLTAILPLWAARGFVQASDLDLLRGIALSHTITIAIKARIGRLTPVCSCSIAAGAGAAAGLTQALGGSTPQILAAILNLLQDLNGVLCDGAKPACALKLATAASSAVKSALLAQQGVRVPAAEGLSAASFPTAMDYLAQLCDQGLQEAGRSVLRILQEKSGSSLQGCRTHR